MLQILYYVAMESRTYCAAVEGRLVGVDGHACWQARWQATEGGKGEYRQAELLDGLASE